MDGDLIQSAKKTREETFKHQVDKIKKYIQKAVSEESACYTHVPFQLQDDTEELLKRQKYKVVFLKNQTCKDENGKTHTLNLTKISWREELVDEENLNNSN
ncbi:hypothetical protein V9L05_17855 [Bernardetia sp. Wsw4-3y2]|uniref:hypothetical protein n=1 Tax=Bernardetia sp. Wsw4-3y2 TaxID=3127471 RepID=UPI0030CEE43F